MGSNLGPHMEVAKLAIFNGEVGKVGGFIMACRLFLRMKLRGATVEVENLPASIEQWYKRATALDRIWRESRREEERLRGRKETGGMALKQEQRQILPRPLVWQRRQMPPQQATTGPAPMEGVKRTNAVIVRGQEQRAGQGAEVPPRWDPYAMEVDQGRNCFACR